MSEAILDYVTRLFKRTKQMLGMVDITYNASTGEREGGESEVLFKVIFGHMAISQHETASNNTRMHNYFTYTCKITSYT